MVIIGLVLAACLALAVLAFLAPQRSRRWQAREDARVRQTERQEEAKGPVHRSAAKALDRSRRAADAAMDAARATREGA